MKLTIEIELANAAFDGHHCGSEIADILHTAASSAKGCSRHDVKMGAIDQTIRDANGNTVGKMEVSE